MQSTVQTWFIGAWGVGCVLALAGAVLTWIYRLPGVGFTDFINGPKGEHPPRALHQFTDAMRLVRPDRHRLIYLLELSGTSIAAAAVFGLLAWSFVVGPGKW